MGSRLRANPEQILECCLEITAPETDQKKDSTIKFIFPPDYSDKEALKTIPGFCYPCISTSEAVQNYTFVLTDIQGQYRFGFCRYSPNVKTCLCILSYLPWFETFYVLLNTISELRKKKDEGDLVVSLLERLMKLNPPTPGYDIIVKPNGSTKEYKFKTPDTDKLPTIPENHNLTDYYAHVEPYNMILLFVSMFFERRIIITSKKLSVLTACTYGAMSLLYPMHWQHMFVPIVPPHLLDYCCAPMPFLAGVHSSLMPSVRKMPLDEVVILNADTNEIECSLNDVESLPSGVISSLKSTLKKIDLPIDDRVSRAFLSAMVSLVGGYRDALRFKPGEKIVFDRDVFIESKSQDKKAFLTSVLQLQLFEQFISERLELLNSGKGFNDLFEEQIGMQAEDQKKLKHQYKQWMKGAKKYAKEGIHETKQNLKVLGKEAKSNLKQMKGNIGDMLKGKDEEEFGGEIKKSNSLPYMKHYGIGAKMSPITRRKALSPQPQPRKAHSFHQDGDHKVRPKRPPPPKSVRDRTNAMSLVIDDDVQRRLPMTRHSTPNLSIEPPIATLVSLDEDQPTKNKKDTKRNTLLDLSEALKDDTIEDATNSTKRSNTQPTKAHPLRRTSNLNRPVVPPRPSIKKKTSTSSLNSAGSSSPSECLLTPLKQIPIDLQKDIIDSLGPDCQMFFPEWQNHISQIHSEISSSAPKNAEDSTTLLDGNTTVNHSTSSVSENSTLPNEELSNSLELTNKQNNVSSNQTTVSLIDTDTSPSEDLNSNSTSTQPSHWVNFE